MARKVHFQISPGILVTGDEGPSIAPVAGGSVPILLPGTT